VTVLHELAYATARSDSPEVHEGNASFVRRFVEALIIRDPQPSLIDLAREIYFSKMLRYSREYVDLSTVKNAYFLTYANLTPILSYYEIVNQINEAILDIEKSISNWIQSETYNILWNSERSSSAWFNPDLNTCFGIRAWDQYLETCLAQYKSVQSQLIRPRFGQFLPIQQCMISGIESTIHEARALGRAQCVAAAKKLVERAHPLHQKTVKLHTEIDAKIRGIIDQQTEALTQELARAQSLPEAASKTIDSTWQRSTRRILQCLNLDGKAERPSEDQTRDCGIVDYGPEEGLIKWKEHRLDLSPLAEQLDFKVRW
jgi:hypothetical protein